MTLTITVTAEANAPGGDFTLTVLGVSKTFTIVASSVVGTPSEPLLNNLLPHSISVVATSPDGPGPLTFASADTGVRFTSTVECSAGEQRVQQITCRPDSNGRLTLSVVIDPKCHRALSASR